MKNSNLIFLFIILFSFQLKSQTADEIINQFIENTGGFENWENLKGIKINALGFVNGEEIPMEMIMLKNGKSMSTMTFQGKEIKTDVYNGEVLWSHNVMTQKAEKADQEATDNAKKEAGLSFPNDFFNYKQKGCVVEKLEDEDYDGTPCFKLKMTKPPLTIDGKIEENVEFYFIDKNTFFAISQQNEIKSGPMKGQMDDSKWSDYQVVGDLIFPFSMAKGGDTKMVITKVELNPVVDEAVFDFPDQK